MLLRQGSELPVALAAGTLRATCPVVPQRESQSRELRPADRAAGFDPALDAAAFCASPRVGPPPPRTRAAPRRTPWRKDQIAASAIYP